MTPRLRLLVESAFEEGIGSMELVRWGSPRDGRLAAEGHILPVKKDP